MLFLEKKVKNQIKYLNILFDFFYKITILSSNLYISQSRIMEYKNHIYNSSVVLNKEGSCTINCPGCNFGVKERKKINKLNIEELKKRIDFASLNLSEGYSLILLPGNVLLEYSNQEMEDIILYACNKSSIVQWELEKIDERILKIFKNKKISELLRTKKLFLNIGYVVGNSELLEKIYIEICKLGIKNIIEILKKDNLVESFRLLDSEQKLNRLKELENQGILKSGNESINFGIHSGHGNKKRKDLVNFLEKEGFCIDNEKIKNVEKSSGDLHFYSREFGVLITLHYAYIQKIDKYGNNIWKLEHIEGNEGCYLLNDKFEWSIGGDKEGTILPHANPCINKVSFGNLNSSKDDLEKHFLEHNNKIFGIITKYQYTKTFDQSQLCNKCLKGEIINVDNKDIIKYILREYFFELKKKIFHILFIQLLK